MVLWDMIPYTVQSV